MQLPLESALLRLGEAFAQGGVELFAVGGWVRDRLLGRPVYDLDIAAAAETVQVEAICRAHPALHCTTRDAGLAALTIHYNFDGICGEAEFTAFRRESYRRDGSHRPVRIEGGATLEEDAARRDFTVNALYARLIDGEVFDPLNGMSDLEKRILRTTRMSDDVFSEDALRLLRLARFACELGFSIETDTWSGACRQAAGLAHIVPSRVGQELTRILLSDQRQPAAGGQAVHQGLSLLHSMGALPYILPELAEDTALDQRIDAAARSAQKFILRLAALCSGLSPQRAHDLCLRLNLGKTIAQRLERLLNTQLDLSDDGEAAVQLAILGKEGARDFADLKQACQEHETAHQAYRLLDAMLRDNLPFSPDELALSGKEIAEIMGTKPGPALGQMKKKLWISVIKRKTVNEPFALGHTIKQFTASSPMEIAAENKEET